MPKIHELISSQSIWAWCNRNWDRKYSIASITKSRFVTNPNMETHRRQKYFPRTLYSLAQVMDPTSVLSYASETSEGYGRLYNRIPAIHIVWALFFLLLPFHNSCLLDIHSYSPTDMFIKQILYATCCSQDYLRHTIHQPAKTGDTDGQRVLWFRFHPGCTNFWAFYFQVSEVWISSTEQAV